MVRTYYVYILTNDIRSVLYIGMTNDIHRRLYEHRTKAVPGFSKTYNLNRLMYFETTSDVHEAIGREKQLKRWSRKKKEALILCSNPHWNDLFESEV